MLNGYYYLVHQEFQLARHHLSLPYLLLPSSSLLQVPERDANEFKFIHPLVQNFTDAKALMTAATARTQTTKQSSLGQHAS